MTALIVTADSENPQHGVLRCGAQRFACVLGRSGIQRQKSESDGATPTGRYPLRRVLYRADKITPPYTGLPLSITQQSDGWCDAPSDPNYNRPVTLPYPASAEEMWRADDLYDVVVVIGHNDAPVVPGAGSAIFLHLAAADRTPTAGCVALAREDLLQVLAACDAQSWIEIR